MEDFKSWHPNFPVNLENCQSEPIHIPGAIQNFGILIAYEPKSRIIKALSQNALSFLPGLKNFEETNILIDSLLVISETNHFSAATKREHGRRLVKVQFVGAANSSEYFYAATYYANDLQILEIETLKNEQVDLSSYLNDLPSMMKDIQNQESMKELVQFAANKIKELTGFDRVMVYQYDEEWNGEVVAEAREEKLEPFLGLHYPASDIPVQARALYEKNWIRIIPTVHYQPSVILPAFQQNLDLSNSILRSVSPIHIKYLKNMGVGASMSISLMVEGKLWGLIACHHYSAHFVPLNIRLGCEAYGQLLSWHIQTLETSDALKVLSAGEKTFHHVLEEFGSDDFKQAAIKIEKQLLELFQCTGMVIRLGDDAIHIGQAPDDIFTAAVAKALVNRSILEPLVTKEAASVPELTHLSPNVNWAGFMALSLAPKHNYYIICTRPEEIQTVGWAGNPNKETSTNFDDPEQRLMPRGSFALWKEIHKGQSARWATETVDLFKRFGLLFVKIVIERKELLEKSNDELKMLSQAKDEFVAMVSHELRTPLNAIIGWTDLALSGELDPKQIPESLKIIQRNARSQNQLINDLLDVSRIISGKMKLSVRNIRVSEVVDAVVLSFVPAADAKMIKIIKHLDEAADSIIGDAERIQQVVWNLLSNAVKFSPKNSKIWISIHRVNSHIVMQVTDQGIGIESGNLKKIFGRFEQVDSSISRKAGGLGLGLAISKHIVELHGGKIEVESEGEGKGATFKVSFPIAPVAPEENDSLPIDDELHSRPIEYTHASKRLEGEVILIVEDETDAAQFLNLLISANGAKTFVAYNGMEALKIIAANKMEIGIVLSDIGMPIKDGYELVKAMRASDDKHISSICAIALTAFGRPQDRIQALRAGFDSYIAKPVMQEELLTVLESACKLKNR